LTFSPSTAPTVAMSMESRGERQATAGTWRRDSRRRGAVLLDQVLEDVRTAALQEWRELQEAAIDSAELEDA
jgi:hypothetical protein